MSDYIIATSSTSDLPRTWLEEHNIPFIAYSYTVNDEPREDDCREETRAAVYAGMRRGDKLHTSMINEFVYYDFLKTFLDEGKDVIFLDMSQKMSVSFVNANKAADKLRAEFPERKLYVMDTLCISGGLGLLVMNMVRRKEAGAGFDEVVAWGEENKLRIAHRFTVDDLNYLKEGGRVSNSAALVGSILDIKPVLYVPNAGTLAEGARAQGGAARHSRRHPARFQRVRPDRHGDPHPAGGLRRRCRVGARRDPQGISPGRRDHDHGARRRHRRALRPRPADGVLPLQRPPAQVKKVVNGDGSC